MDSSIDCYWLAVSARPVLAQSCRWWDNTVHRTLLYWQFYLSWSWLPSAPQSCYLTHLHILFFISCKAKYTGGCNAGRGEWRTEHFLGISGALNQSRFMLLPLKAKTAAMLCCILRYKWICWVQLPRRRLTRQTFILGRHRCCPASQKQKHSSGSSRAPGSWRLQRDANGLICES